MFASHYVLRPDSKLRRLHADAYDIETRWDIYCETGVYPTGPLPSPATKPSTSWWRSWFTRDLTADGDVESNPGPSSNKMQKKAKRISHTCQLCKKVFTTQKALVQHAATHKMPGSGGRGIRNLPTVNKNDKRSVIQGSGRSVNKLLRTLDSQVLGTSVEGKKWALRCLHPCDEQGGGTLGIPDTTNLPVSLPECRSQTVVGAPHQITAGQTWDLVALIPDNPEIALVLYTKLSGQGWVTVRNNLNSATPTYSAPLIVNYSLFSAGGLSKDATQWRTTHRGATFHLNASYIANQGMVYADNYPVDYVRVSADAAPGPPPVPALAASLVRVPLMDPNSMTQRSTRLYVNNAREGCYVVMYPVDATGAMPYFDEQSIGGDNANARVQFQYPDEWSPYVPGIPYQAPAYQTLLAPVARTAIGGFSAGIVVFEGLDSTATVQIKTKAGIEMVPTNDSIAQAFTTQSPLLDRVALDAVARVAQRAPGAYPADYNDLSKVLGSIWDTVRGVAGPLAGIGDFVGGLGIPVVSGIAGGVSGLIRELGLH